MSKKYEQLAKEIIEKVGGNSNIDTLHHCQTRLRFKLTDNNKADQEGLSKLEGVAKVMVSGACFRLLLECM